MYVSLHQESGSSAVADCHAACPPLCRWNCWYVAMSAEPTGLLGFTLDSPTSKCRAATAGASRSSSRAAMAASLHTALMSAPVYLHRQKHATGVDAALVKARLGEFSQVRLDCSAGRIHGHCRGMCNHNCRQHRNLVEVRKLACKTSLHRCRRLMINCAYVTARYRTSARQTYNDKA